MGFSLRERSRAESAQMAPGHRLQALPLVPRDADPLRPLSSALSQHANEKRLCSVSGVLPDSDHRGRARYVVISYDGWKPTLIATR